MNETKIFENQTALPDDDLTIKEMTLLGFDARYIRIRDQLRLLLNVGDLGDWNRKYHAGNLALCALVAEQHPLAVFHGDVGTGKTATADCIANRMVREAHAEGSILFKLSTRVRGSGRVGEMGTLLADAFQKVTQAASNSRHAILVIDEGDSLAATRSQEHSHHEDKVAVNTLIQGIDDLRRFRGRIVVILCTNRVSILDPALQRRAAIIEAFTRPSAEDRRDLFAMDLTALSLSDQDLTHLVNATGAQNGEHGWTYSDIRTRLYPAALARAFPERPLHFDDLREVAAAMKPSPRIEDI